MIENDDRDFGESEFARGQESAVASDDPSLRIHQDWIVETELRDAGGDLCDLGVGVGPRVPGPRNQFVEQPHLDVLGHPFEVFNWFGCHQLLTSHADWPGPDWSTKGPVDLVTILHPSIPRQSNSSLDQLQSGKRGKEGKVKVRGRPNSRAISMGKAGPLYP